MGETTDTVGYTEGDPLINKEEVPGGEELVTENEKDHNSDKIIEKLSRNRTWKFNAYVVWLTLIWMPTPTVLYLTSFAGETCF